MFIVHPINVGGNIPLVGDDGDGFAVVVFESHLNHVFNLWFVLTSYIIIIAHGRDKLGHFWKFLLKNFFIASHRAGETLAGRFPP